MISLLKKKEELNSYGLLNPYSIQIVLDYAYGVAGEGIIARDTYSGKDLGISWWQFEYERIPPPRDSRIEIPLGEEVRLYKFHIGEQFAERYCCIGPLHSADENPGPDYILGRPDTHKEFDEYLTKVLRLTIVSAAFYGNEDLARYIAVCRGKHRNSNAIICPQCEILKTITLEELVLLKRDDLMAADLLF